MTRPDLYTTLSPDHDADNNPDRANSFTDGAGAHTRVTNLAVEDTAERARTGSAEGPQALAGPSKLEAARSSSAEPVIEALWRLARENEPGPHRDHEWILSPEQHEQFEKLHHESGAHLGTFGPDKARLEYDEGTRRLSLRMRASPLYENFTGELCRCLMQAIETALARVPELREVLPSHGQLRLAQSSAVRYAERSIYSPDCSIRWAESESPFLVLETEWHNALSEDKFWNYIEKAGVDVVIAAHIQRRRGPEPRRDRSEAPSYELRMSVYCNEPSTDDPQLDDASCAVRRRPVSKEASIDDILQLRLSWLSRTLRDNASANNVSISITNDQVLDILSSAAQVQHRFDNPAPASSSAGRRRSARRRGQDVDDEGVTRDTSHEMIRRSRRGSAAREG